MAGLAQNLSFILLGEDKSASSTMTKAQSTAEKVTGAIGGAFSKLGGIIGGEFGNILDEAGNGIEELGSKGAKLSTTLQVTGGVMAAAGLALQNLGSGEKQASDQLDAAITASGSSVEDYAAQIDKAVSSGENFDHTAIDTKQALTTLTEATGSTATALSKMGIVTDLAAAKHESLQLAASQVAKILNGNGGKTLAAYGIIMDGVGSKTEQGARALEQLAKKLEGQATSSVDNFGSRVDILKTKVTDWVEEMAGPVGNVLTVVGTVTGIAGTALEFYQARQAASAAAALVQAADTTIATTAIEGQTAAIEAEGTAAVVAGVKNRGFGASIAALATGPIGFAALGVGALYAVSAIGTLTDAAASNTIEFKKASDASAAFNKQLALIQEAGPKGILGNADSNRGQALQLTTGLNKTFGDFFASIGASGLNPAIEGATASISKIDAAMAELVQSGNAKEAAAEFDKWKDAAKAAGIPLSDLKAEFPGYTSAVTGAGTATKVTGDQVSAATAKMVLENDAAGLLTNALTLLNGGALTLMQAQTGQAAATNALTQSLHDNGKEIEGTTVAAVANQQALESKAAADQQAAEAVAKSTGSTVAGTQAYADSKTALEQALAAQGNLTPAIQAYIDKLYAIPPVVPTQLEVDNAEALAKIAAVKAAWNSGLTMIKGNVVFSDARNSATGHAAGGVFTKPTQIGNDIFGESGPESWTVTPLNSGRVGGDAGTTVINITVNGGLDSSAAIGKAVSDAVLNSVKTGAVSKQTWQQITGAAA